MRDVQGHGENPGVDMTKRRRSFEAAFNLLCGDLLGEGIHRKVFSCKIDPSLVVKVETDEDYRSFANAYEHRNWTDNEHYIAVANWLAPVVSISACGFVMLQKRITPVRLSELPEKLPSFLTDIKPDNFGLYEGRLVACDYSTLITRVNTSLRKAEWSQ